MKNKQDIKIRIPNVVGGEHLGFDQVFHLKEQSLFLYFYLAVMTTNINDKVIKDSISYNILIKSTAGYHNVIKDTAACDL